MKSTDKKNWKNGKLSDAIVTWPLTGEAKQKYLDQQKRNAMILLPVVSLFFLLTLVWKPSFISDNAVLLFFLVFFIGFFIYQVITKTTAFHFLGVQKRQNKRQAQGNKQDLEGFAEAMKKSNGGKN